MGRTSHEARKAFSLTGAEQRKNELVSGRELWNNDSLDRAKLVQFEGKLEASTYRNGR